jgi:hypothetical protein
LTLVVVPVVYSYLDDFGAWSRGFVRKWFGEPEDAKAPVAAD